MLSDKPITRDTRISDVIKICPTAPEVFTRHGMGCFACMAASAETVEEGAEMHGIDVDAVLHELNSACKPQDTE